MNLNTFKIKSIVVITILILTSLYSNAQSPIGAWERYYDDDNGNTIRSVVIFSEKFQSIAMYNAKSGEFIYSNGGTWELNDNKILKLGSDYPKPIVIHEKARLKALEAFKKI